MNRVKKPCLIPLLLGDLGAWRTLSVGGRPLPGNGNQKPGSRKLETQNGNLGTALYSSVKPGARTRSNR